MKSIRKLYKSIIISFVLFCSGAVMVSAADQGVIVNNPSTNAVYVRTGNSSLSITNNTWDQRLSYIQTATQGTKTNLDTLLNRFGFTGTFYTLSDALSLMYSEQQSINSNFASVVTNGAILVNSSDSDLLDAFNTQFSPRISGSTALSVYIQALSERFAGQRDTTYTTPYTYPWFFNQLRLNSDSIKSELITVDNKLFDAVSYLSSIQSYTGSYLPDIQSDTSFISTETSNIRGYIRDYFPSFGNYLNNISSYTSYLPGTYSDLHVLKEFFADDDTVAQKAAAKASSDKAIDTFTGAGKNAASGQNFSDMGSYADELKTSFNSNVAPSNMTNILSDGSNWGWFSQATYDSINPSSNMRKSSLNDYSVESYMALYEQLQIEGVPDPLQDFYKDLSEAVDE